MADYIHTLKTAPGQRVRYGFGRLDVGQSILVPGDSACVKTCPAYRALRNWQRSSRHSHKRFWTKQSSPGWLLITRIE